MRVQVAPDLVSRHQFRQRMVARDLDFAPILAQLGRNPVHAQALVDLGFVAAVQHLARVDLLYAVLADLQPGAHGRLAQRHVVVLGAGQVLQQVAEHLRLDHAQLDAAAVMRDAGQLRVPAGLDLGHPLGPRQGVTDHGRPPGGDHQVDVLCRVGEPAQAAGDLALLDV